MCVIIFFSSIWPWTSFVKTVCCLLAICTSTLIPLVYPPKSCITFVFHFSWPFYTDFPRKIKDNAYAKLWGTNKLCYGRCANGKYSGTLKNKNALLFNLVPTVILPLLAQLSYIWNHYLYCNVMFFSCFYACYIILFCVRVSMLTLSTNSCWFWSLL